MLGVEIQAIKDNIFIVFFIKNNMRIWLLFFYISNSKAFKYRTDDYDGEI